MQENPTLKRGRRGAYPVARYAAPFLLALLGAGPAQADFSGDYVIDNWTSTGNGSVDTSGAPLSITVKSPDTGSGLPETQDFTIAVAADGLWSFDWSYGSVDLPSWDSAGWLLNDVFTVLADTSGASGSFSISVTAGDIIGFRASTEDSTSGPGFLTITQFSVALPPPAPTPEPSTLPLFALGAAGVTAIRRRVEAV